MVSFDIGLVVSRICSLHKSIDIVHVRAMYGVLVPQLLDLSMHRHGFSYDIGIDAKCFSIGLRMMFHDGFAIII